MGISEIKIPSLKKRLSPLMATLLTQFGRANSQKEFIEEIDGEVIQWLKKDGDNVLKGEPVAYAYPSISVTTSVLDGASGIFVSKEAELRSREKVAILANGSGILAILVLPHTPLKPNALIAKIEAVDELVAYLALQQEQDNSRQFDFNDRLSPIDIFYSYDYEDELLRKELEKHLSSLRSQRIITDWHDRGITAGMEWESTVNSHLDTADIILLLVSPDFMASDYRYSKEMQRAMQRGANGEARVVPILLRPVDWKGASFATLPVLPNNEKPVILWASRDDAFVNIVTGIRKIIQEILETRLQLLGNRMQEINVPMRELGKNYRLLRATLKSFPDEKKRLNEEEEIVRRQLEDLHLKMQTIQKQLSDLPHRKAECENGIAAIQQQATELHFEEKNVKQAYQKLAEQINRVKP